MELRVHDEAAMAGLAAILNGARGGRGEVIVSAALPGGGKAWLVLGRGFTLDAELAGQIEGVQGISDVTLRPADGRRLALVG
jgi:DNA polymerase-3 subunit alpha